MTQLLLLALLLVVIIYIWTKNKKKRQLKFIENYQFPAMMLSRVQKQHSYLTNEDMQKVAQAMKDYFYICNQANGIMLPINRTT